MEIFFYLLILILAIKPLGEYMAKIYSLSPNRWRFLDKVEHIIYKIVGVDSNQGMDWRAYVFAMLGFNLLGFLFVYFLLRVQNFLPLNPENFAGVLPDLAFNVASSFVTNTNWQAYSGESNLAYCVQMMALTVQNFLSAATGLSLMVGFIRGLTNVGNGNLGNYWVDMLRGILYLLLPLSFIVAVVLVSQGVIQNFNQYEVVEIVQPYSVIFNEQKIQQIEQKIPMGPVASQVAIKQLGTNGGGFFNTNSAHPFENPTPFSNFIEALAILLLPAASCYMFGVLVSDRRQGIAILFAMFVMFLPFLWYAVHCEQSGNPMFTKLQVQQQQISGLSAGGNMEGKETRFGINSSVFWSVATTATSNGSVNSMLDSYTPMGGFVSIWMMHLGEVVFGGLGSGIYSILLMVVITVFISGLMVGRTPEYLGKKIEPYEMKMACFGVLVISVLVLLTTAFAVLHKQGVAAIYNPGAHGFSEILYAFTSMTNNNGSAFAGLNSNVWLYNVLGGLAMLIARYWFVITVLAIAGSMSKKKMLPVHSGTLPTHTPLFVFMLAGVIMIVAGLSFLPSLALGPIVEHFALWDTYG